MNLYLGSGPDHKEGWTNVDIANIPGVDVVCDIEQTLPFEDNSVDQVFTQDTLEHIHPDKRVFVMSEIYRILKIGGRMEHWCPYGGSRNDLASPSHLSHWNERTFEYFESGNRRFENDKKWNGFKGHGFKMILNEPQNLQDEWGRQMPQTIHVIMEKV